MSCLIKVFLIFNCTKLAFIEVNTRKWSLILIIIPLSISEPIMVTVSTWLVIVVLHFVTHAGQCMKGKTPAWKTKLKKWQTFVLIEESKEFILRSPIENKFFLWFLQITVFISSKNFCASRKNYIFGIFPNNFNICIFYAIAVSALFLCILRLRLLWTYNATTPLMGIIANLMNR